MAKRILAALCGLLLCIALVGLVLGATANATLLDAGSAQAAMRDSGFLAERTAYIRDTLARPFDDMGLDSEMLQAVVNEETVRTALNTSVEGLLQGGDGLVSAEGSFATVGTDAVAALEAGGGTVTAEGLAQIEQLLQFCEFVFAELTVAPMAGVIQSLGGLLGAGGGVASVVICAILAVLAVCGVAFASHSEKTMSLYLSSGLLGAGLALVVPGFVLNARRAALSTVLSQYYAPFYSILLAVGAVLALAGLLLLVVRLARIGK